MAKLQLGDDVALPKKVWRIPVIWESYGVMMVEATTLEEAKEKAILVEPLPSGTYIEDSITIDDEGIVEEMNKE